MLLSDRNAKSWRVALFALIVVIAQAVLILNLYKVQLSHGEVYTERLRQQTTVAIRLSPARGAIVDRNDVALAENRSSFDVDFYLDELQRNYSRSHRGHLPYIEVPYKRHGEVRMSRQVDIVTIVNEALEPVAQGLGFANRPDEKELREHFRIRKDIPYQFRTDVDFNTLARFSERNFGVPGIDIVARPVRHYNFGSLASHILGHVGRPDENSNSMAEDGYPYETVGKSGVEDLMDVQLQGKPGGKLLRVNYRGYVDREEKMKNASVGNVVKLTLDARIQYIVEQAMRGVGRGAAVVMDPNTGDVLAMASVPNYDPNHFIPKISNKELMSMIHDDTAPLVNRAVSTYPPGSTYKVLIALSALKSKAITRDTIIDSPGAIDIGGHLFRDWSPNGQGPIKLREALKMSCNTFFYQVGIKTKIENIDDLGELVGFGHPTGVLLKPELESAGVLPGPEWLKEHRPKERWTQAYTANTSIGQGYVAVSPMQMVCLMSAVANGGTVYKPRLIEKVTSPEGETVLELPDKQVRSDLGMSQDNINAVKEGLFAVVDEGTGKKASIPGIKIAGKTGTAQAKRRLNGQIIVDNKTWFYGFAPYDTPRYVFCVMVEGGVAGGTTCAPIAHDILNAIFAMEKDSSQIKLSYLTPVVGHFRGVSDVGPSNLPGVDQGTAGTGAAAAASASAGAPADANVDREGDHAPPTDNSDTDASGDTPTILREDNGAPAIMPKRRY